MRIGFFRRLGAYLLDAVPIFLLVTAMLSWFVGDLIKDNIEDYRRLEVIYNESEEAYLEYMDVFYQQFLDGDLTEEEFNEIRAEEQKDFIHNNTYLIDVVVYGYAYAALAYVGITFNIIYLAYQLVMKGNTLGRKMMGMELKGKVTWYNILLREFFWKHLFWYGTLTAGIPVDIGLIAFTKKKKALRDIFSKTYLAPIGVDYPF